ncbi:MAG: hypothetical protein J6B94_04390 [Lachnospiraceae bacterium]|nr:hypothetical protein [Lachnospiraceae bacterium]
MMQYEIFKEVVKERFLSQMPDDFLNHTVAINSVVKVNRTEDRLHLIPPDGVSIKVLPSISMNRMYEDYQRTGNLEGTLATSAFDLVVAYRTVPQDVGEKIFENARENVVMMLVNTEQNKELLQSVPHREFCDLSIVYRLVAEIDENGIQSAMIGNNLAESLGLDEQALYKAAVENTKRLLPPVTKNMNEVIKDMFAAEGMLEEIAEMLVEEMSAETTMYVISNNQGINGAVSMLYENELHALAEKLETDLYLLPSSTHEVIAVSATVGDPYELAQMVAEINMGQVELADRLSNQVYHYDKDLRKLTIATDTPNKRLDGIVTESSHIYGTKQSR